MTIARTESSSLMSETSLKVYQSSGVQKKEWITSADGKARDSCKAAAAQGPIPVNKSFVNGFMHPQEPNCRCSISPVVRLD